MSATLYGIGVGPGDPDLVTRKAARLIAACRVVAYPALAGSASFARAVVADLIAPGTREIVINVPMQQARAPAQRAYDTGAARIAEALEAGQDVACLCEGDPFFFGSFMYIHARLAARFRVEVVPGVTSLCACTAVAGRPLAARNESVTILPAPLPDDELRLRIAGAQSVVVMKVGRHLARIRAILDDLKLTGRAIYVARASLPDQVVCPLAEVTGPAPYFSMILITRGADPWL